MKEVLKGIWPHTPLVKCSERGRAERGRSMEGEWSKWEPEIGQRPPSTPNPFGYSVQLLVAISRPDGRHCHSIILAPALAYFLTTPETTTTPTTSHRQTNKNGSHTHTHTTTELVTPTTTWKKFVIFVACLLRFALLLHIFHLLHKTFWHVAEQIE